METNKDKEREFLSLWRDMIFFLRDAAFSATRGGRAYHLWMGTLAAIALVGGLAWVYQIVNGLAVTNMTDHVSWGLYISNFTFLVGVAAAAVMLVMPAYILHDVDFKKAVLMGEGVAVAAVVMCLGFVTVDLGSPLRAWHMMPVIGYFNWPRSMLTWDVLVLNGYLALNVAIPFYILFSHYRGREPHRSYVGFVILSVFWAVAIHLVTAFLYAGLPARPFWHNALLGPRFLASAFAAGPSFILIALAVIDRLTPYKIGEPIFRKLGLIITVAAQINLIMLGSEAFKEFYWPVHHSESAHYLFFGLRGNSGLVPWIWSAITINIIATVILTLHPLRRKRPWLLAACAMLFVGIWIEKGMGLIVPGFLPSPLGEIVEYLPSRVEISVTAGIWAVGLMVYTVLVRVALPIELGCLRRPDVRGGHCLCEEAGRELCREKRPWQRKEEPAVARSVAAGR